MRRIILTAALTLAGISVANAMDCDNAPDQATMHVCADMALKATDKQLNITYQAITRRLADNPDTAKLLVKSQRAWMAFRDAECAFRTSGVSGGSAYPTVLLTCIDGMTRTRLDTLKELMNCQEGDMSCPVPAE
ncbi:lysozyme inhibitor LprI family protein [Kaistia defluvii]|uniref:lysozyme inhibitor LprI family protein n=1 Tax=Kaistia defluvii TaxID=410841 RepID=UPI0022595AC9|nr:lysozyme inhibitor LprI family protein [Kaistia defluvii]MCX5520917.1 lysozyme inhibitor LprI family protein [Kaistia defluvii]